MKKKIKNSEQDIEHRGFDGEATKNFGLEMKIVKQYNDPALAHKDKKAEDDNNNQGGL